MHPNHGPRRARALILASVIMLTVSACASAGSGDFPSLAKRPVEGTLTVVPPAEVPPPPPPPASADLASRIAALMRSVDTGDAAFAAAMGSARQSVANASGAGPGSDAWVAAHQAISRADAARAPTTAALADLDALVVAQNDLGDRAGIDELTAARDRAAERVAAQDSAVAALVAALRPA